MISFQKQVQNLSVNSISTSIFYIQSTDYVYLTLCEM